MESAILDPIDLALLDQLGWLEVQPVDLADERPAIRRRLAAVNAHQADATELRVSQDGHMGITITRTHEGYSAKGDDLSVEAPTLAQLVELLSDAGCHSTDISDAVDAAGLPWPKVSE